VKHWNALISKRPDYWDQNAFNDLLKSGYTGKPMPGGLFKGYNQKLRAGILPVATFCSGHTYFVQRLPMRCAPEVTLLEGLHQLYQRLHHCPHRIASSCGSAGCTARRTWYTPPSSSAAASANAIGSVRCVCGAIRPSTTIHPQAASSRTRRTSPTR
jgi:hypothetical protein